MQRKKRRGNANARPSPRVLTPFLLLLTRTHRASRCPAWTCTPSGRTGTASLVRKREREREGEKREETPARSRTTPAPLSLPSHLTSPVSLSRPVLSNDHKALTKRIDAVLQDLHAAAQEEGGGGGGMGPVVAAAAPPPPRRAPPTAPAPGGAAASAAATTVAAAPAAPVGFAVVDEVSPGSPAEAAGLRLGDRVLSVGGECALAAVPAAVGAAAEAGAVLPVSLLRAGAVVEVALAPRAGWGGRGVLGCRLRPV